MNIVSNITVTTIATLLAVAPLARADVGVDLVTGTTKGSKLFDPEYAIYAPAEIGGYEIGVRRGPDGSLSLQLAKPGAATLLVGLPSEVAQIRQLRAVGGKLVTTGWMNGSGAMAVAIVDIGSGKALDVLWGYDVSISPDSRYLAFRKFYPSHGVEQWESQYRIYDVTSSPELQRASRVIQSQSGSDGKVDVGLAVYPTAPGEVDRDPADLSNDEVHQALSPFAWSGDSRKLAFVDAQRGTARLVTVDMRAVSAGRPGVQTATLAELGRVCSGEDARGCARYSPDHLRVQLGNRGVTVSHRAPGHATRVISVAPSRFVAEAR
jgi:hypothetical protein